MFYGLDKYLKILSIIGKRKKDTFFTYYLRKYLLRKAKRSNLINLNQRLRLFSALISLHVLNVPLFV